MKPYPIICPAIPSGQIYQFTTSYEVDYEVRFGRKKENILHSIVVFGVLNEEYEGEEYVITNKGDVLRVMTTIAEVVKIYLVEHPNLQVVEFTGILKDEKTGRDSEKTSQRTMLYMRFIPRVFPLDNWVCKVDGNRILATKITKEE